MGTYKINQTLTVTGKDFAVVGSGYGTEIVCKWAPPLTVTQATNVSIEQLMFSAPMGIDKIRIEGGGSTPIYVRLDGLYAINTKKNTQLFNDSGLVINNLRNGDNVHAIHLDTNTIIQDSAPGTVLVGFMAQSVLTVKGTGESYNSQSTSDAAAHWPRVAGGSIAGPINCNPAALSCS